MVVVVMFQQQWMLIVVALDSFVVIDLVLVTISLYYPCSSLELVIVILVSIIESL